MHVYGAKAPGREFCSYCDQMGAPNFVWIFSLGQSYLVGPRNAKKTPKR